MNDSDPHADALPATEVGASEAPSGPQQVDFPCGNCGAKLTWDPVVDALSCAHCGATQAVPRADGEILERGLTEAGDAARGFGIEARAVKCSNCGASVVLDEALTATHCIFCGSASVLPQDANRNALRPESLIPLDVGREAVEQSFRRWLARLWFRPNALRELKRFDAVGVYVPTWTFDCRVHSDWSANAGHYYWTTQLVPVYSRGRVRMRTRRVRKIRWVPAWGERDDVYDDLLVHASQGVPEELAAKLGAWDTSALVPYRPEYLAGWRAEEYRVDLEQAWELGRERVLRSQARRCAGDVPGDTYRDLRVSNALDDVRWKHVLLPIWSLTFEFGGRTYPVLIHGQSGRVHGRAPWSWAKILAAALAIALGLALGLLLLALA